MNPAELKTILTSYHLSPRKKLGQNFLIDQNIQKKIIENCQIKPGDLILEIGPGLGALTKDLAQALYRNGTGQAQELVIVEKDKGFVSVLKETLSDFKNIKILEDDILNIKLRKVFKNLGDKKIKVIGNLPYYLTTPIIFYLLEQKSIIDSIFITIQKEVGARMLAKPGGKDYGRLSLSVQYLTTPKLLLSIPRGAFYPQPKVDSYFIKLEIKKDLRPKVADIDLFFNLINTSFSQRRKVILNSLAEKKPLSLPKERVRQILLEAQIDPSRRPETLTIEEFAHITDIIAGKG